MANETKYSVPLCRLDCIGADPHDYAYLTVRPAVSYSIPPVDVYGGLGFDSVSVQGTGKEKFCDLYAYCDGPTDDGVTSAYQWDRYITRWVAILENDQMFYGKVGDIIIPAPAELFPEGIYEDVTKISISFDANARPVFCLGYKSGLIEIRRFEAGSYIKYSFNGTSPVLIFNGILQYDLDQRDVVCYYVSGSDLIARFQRDNFTTEYILDDSVLGYTLSTTDRGRGEIPNTHILVSRSISGTNTLFFVDYDPWPEVKVEFASSSAVINSDIDHSPVVVTEYLTETPTAIAVINSDIVYQTINADISQVENATSSAVINADVSYLLVAVALPETEQPTAVAVVNSDVYYYESIVPFSETESPTASATINSDISYIV